MKQIIISILFFGLSTVFAQTDNSTFSPYESDEIIYRHEYSVGARLMSNGWQLFFDRSWIKDIENTRSFQIEFGEIRSYTEKKQSPETPGYRTTSGVDVNRKKFFYGKQNKFFFLRFAYGNKKIIANKAEKNGVRIGLTYMGGITLGLLKPYFLELAYEVRNQPGEQYLLVNQKYTDVNEDKYLDIYSINGASKFKYGLKEIEPVPGAYVKLGLNFDFASREKIVKMIEAGVMLDVFYKRVPIMVDNDDNKIVNFSAYVSFQIGKRWFYKRNE
ncbi:MAG: hypothetical protein WD048_15755 [Chitinophagales bacterium]